MVKPLFKEHCDSRMEQLKKDLDYHNNKIAEIKFQIRILITATNATYGKFAHNSTKRTYSKT